MARIVEDEAGEGEDGLAECPELFCAGAVSIGIGNNHFYIREAGKVLVEVGCDTVGNVLGTGCFAEKKENILADAALIPSWIMKLLRNIE